MTHCVFNVLQNDNKVNLKPSDNTLCQTRQQKKKKNPDTDGVELRHVVSCLECRDNSFFIVFMSHCVCPRGTYTCPRVPGCTSHSPLRRCNCLLCVRYMLMAFYCRAGGGLFSLLCTELSGVDRRAATAVSPSAPNRDFKIEEDLLSFLETGSWRPVVALVYPCFGSETIFLILAFAKFTRMKKKCFKKEMQNTFGITPPPPAIDLTGS